MATGAEIIDDYLAVLQREPTDAEFVVALAQTATAGGQEALVTRLAGSEEVDEFVAPVIRVYQAVFGRVPDAGGLDFWTRFYRDNREADASFGDDGALQAMTQGFVESAEFRARFPSAAENGTVTQAFVDALYEQTLGRAPGDEERAFYLEAAGTITTTMTAFAQSPEFASDSDGEIELFLIKAAAGEQDFEGSLFDTDDDGAADDEGQTAAPEDVPGDPAAGSDQQPGIALGITGPVSALSFEAHRPSAADASPGAGNWKTREANGFRREDDGWSAAANPESGVVPTGIPAVLGHDEFDVYA